MHLEYFILNSVFISAVILSCHTDGRDVKEQQTNSPGASPAAVANEHTNRKQEEQVILIGLHLNHHNGLSDQKQDTEHTVDPTAGKIESQTDLPSKFAIDGDDSNSVHEDVSLEILQASDKDNKTAVSDSVPSGVTERESDESQTTSQEAGALAKDQNNVDNQHMFHFHEDRSKNQAVNDKGFEERIQENVLKMDSELTQTPDAILPEIKTITEGGELLESTERLDVHIVSSGVVTSTAVTSESHTQAPDEQQAQETSLFDTPPVREKLLQDDKEPIDPLPIKSDVSQSFATGSGGMVVEDYQDLDELTKSGAEVKKLTEDFQTFGEWRKKVLEEELEKENEKVKQEAKDGGNKDMQSLTTAKSQKLRVNYASEKCGAKVVASNPEMENGNYMLTANKDQYMINLCSFKKWFVVELCEPISFKTVELASLELFSSQPRSFRLLLSDRYPTKEWISGGTFEMTPDKVPQSFSLTINSPYVKFVHIEMLDHYGTEHFCPVTLFRVFGLPMEDDDEDEDGVTSTELEENEEDGGTLFAQTKDTVVNLVKKVLYQGEGHEREQDVGETTKEKSANISEEEALPCDPDVENKRLPQKTLDGTPVTVFHPKPTAEESSSSAVPGEIPMVTKLDDGEQLEIEEKAKSSETQSEDIVILLESRWVTAAWDRAWQLCEPKANAVAQTCSNNLACQYVEALLGAPPPISQPKSSFDYPPAYSLEQPSGSHNLQPSFTSQASVMQNLRTLSRSQENLTTDSDMYIQPSSEIALGLEAVSDMSDHTPSEIVSTNILTGQIEQEDNSKMDSLSEKLTDLSEAVSAADLEKSPVVSVIPKGKPLIAANGRMLETDPGEPATPSTDIVSVDSLTVQAESATKSAQDEIPVDKTTEIEPSIQLDTTSVYSRTLTRPTPVLEMAGASVSAGGPRAEVMETVMPSLSPSPTSETADVLSLVDSIGHPQIIHPTVEESQPVLKSEAPNLPEEVVVSSERVTEPKIEEVSASQNATDNSGSQNSTEKKPAEIDLVKVPLSLSAKRETAIMRLTNRIKALELNVSLSSRFLEELSTRFKKQNEEIMKMLNKTMNKLNITTSASQKQVVQQENRIDLLETRLDNLTAAVQTLTDKIDIFTEQMADRQMTFTTFNLLLVVLALYLFYRGCQSKPVHPDVQFLLDTMPRRPLPSTSFPRRNSDVTLPYRHDPDLAVGTLMKKGGSVTNLAGTYGGQGLLFSDKSEMCSRKKKRKKSKPHKTGSLDEECVGRADSDTGMRGSRTDVSCIQNTGKLGHRRCGSDSTSLSNSKASEVVKLDAGKDVQFVLGEIKTKKSEKSHAKSLWASPCPSVSLPYIVSPLRNSSAAENSQMTTARSSPLPRNQRSKSFSVNPFDVGVGTVLSKNCRSNSQAPTVSLADTQKSTDKSTLQHCLWSKAKKSLISPASALNGQKETKGTNSEHSYFPRYKGSLRGIAGIEEGKGIGGKDWGKGRGGKNP